MVGLKRFRVRAVGVVGGVALGAVCVLGLFELGLQLHAAVEVGRGGDELQRRLAPHAASSDDADNHGGDHDSEFFDAGVKMMMPALMLHLCIFLFLCIAPCLALFCHWHLCIRPTAAKYIPARPMVPEDLRGRWKFGIFNCFGDVGTCCCFAWCGPCMLADLWYRSGWLHAAGGSIVDGSERGSCRGWPFCVGVFGYCLVADTAGCFIPFGLAALRGGIGFVNGSDGGLGDVTPHRKLFGIPHAGLSTFIEDCLLWCCCSPCVGTQEYRQVMDLLNRGPVQQTAPMMPPVMGQMVGQPVHVGHSVQGGQPAQVITGQLGVLPTNASV